MYMEYHHESHDSIPSYIRGVTNMLDYIIYIQEPVTLSFSKNRRLGLIKLLGISSTIISKSLFDSIKDEEEDTIKPF